MRATHRALATRDGIFAVLPAPADGRGIRAPCPSGGIATFHRESFLRSPMGAASHRPFWGRYFGRMTLRVVTVQVGSVRTLRLREPHLVGARSDVFCHAMGPPRGFQSRFAVPLLGRRLDDIRQRAVKHDDSVGGRIPACVAPLKHRPVSRTALLVASRLVPPSSRHRPIVFDRSPSRFRPPSNAFDIRRRLPRGRGCIRGPSRRGLGRLTLPLGVAPARRASPTSPKTPFNDVTSTVPYSRFGRGAAAGSATTVSSRAEHAAAATPDSLRVKRPPGHRLMGVRSRLAVRPPIRRPASSRQRCLSPLSAAS